MIYKDFCKCAISHIEKAIEFLGYDDIMEDQAIKIRGELIATIQRLEEVIEK